jgi:hypothetical protein
MVNALYLLVYLISTRYIPLPIILKSFSLSKIPPNITNELSDKALLEQPHRANIYIPSYDG